MTSADSTNAAPQLKDAILSQFEPEIATQLIQFGASLSSLAPRPDLFVFMARKSLCLYELLLALGIRPIESQVVSDRTLSWPLQPFVGKSVVLVDDSLILGTTLAAARKQVLAAGASEVRTHVFCIDDEWWCPSLITPDNKPLRLSDRQTMTFCSSLVRALSLIPRPYLTDFPILTGIRTRGNEIDRLLSNVEWRSHNITTELQRRQGIVVYTFFPNDDLLEDVFGAVRSGLFALLQITKLRMFVRLKDDIQWTRLVPLVTLRPMRHAEIASLTRLLLNRLQEASGVKLEALRNAAANPVAQHRLAQYILSAALGQRVVRSMSAALGRTLSAECDSTEADWHYGPWFHDEMVAVGGAALSSINSIQQAPPDDLCFAHASAEVPPTCAQWIHEVLPTASSPELGQAVTSDSSGINLVSEFTEVFLSLFDTKEIPARHAAKALHATDLEQRNEPLSHRLNLGIPWGALEQHFAGRLQLFPVDRISHILSLTLDLCNDVGIAVPVTCDENGVVFRAYRYGEDVRFSDGELALAYELLAGVLKSSRRESLDHLSLEKCLVLMIRIGLARGFLEPVYGASGVDGTVRIGFHLKGAVPVLTKGPRDRVDRDIWLSRYLVKRGVFTTQNGQYSLGAKVPGNFARSGAPDDAFSLGWTLGCLLTDDGSSSRSVLDARSLTILATCWPPRHAAASLQVELDLFSRWFDENGHALVESLEWKDVGVIERRFEAILRSSGREALRSAATLKFLSYQEERHRGIIEKCAAALERTADEARAREWRATWASVDVNAPSERELFDPHIRRAAVVAWVGTAFLDLSLIALSIGLARATDARRFSRPARLTRQFSTLSSKMATLNIGYPEEVKTIEERLRAVSASSPGSLPRFADFRCDKAMSHAKAGLHALTTRARSVIEELDAIIDYGRLPARHDYSCVVYYDIIDSTGTVAMKRGVDVESHRKRVLSFKRSVNEALYQRQIAVAKKRAEVFAFNGDADSMNDAKHLFISGEFAMRHAADLVEMLIGIASAHPRLRLRCFAVECAFAGSTAYRVEKGTEVQGSRFWEHLSRLLRECKDIEARMDRDFSLLFVLGATLVKRWPTPSTLDVVWSGEGDLTSRIEGLELHTPARWGSVNIA